MTKSKYPNPKYKIGDTILVDGTMRKGSHGYQMHQLILEVQRVVFVTSDDGECGWLYEHDTSDGIMQIREKEIIKKL